MLIRASKKEDCREECGGRAEIDSVLGDKIQVYFKAKSNTIKNLGY